MLDRSDIISAGGVDAVQAQIAQTPIQQSAARFGGVSAPLKLMVEKDAETAFQVAQ